MQSQDLPPNPPEEIPEDATIVRQIQWAWLWSSAPWIIALAALGPFGFGLIPDPFIASLIALVILAPRYFQYRRTEYIITDDSLIFRRGGIIGSQSYVFPLSRLKDIKSRYGMFGRTLGYQTVDIMIENGNLVSLNYVPALVDFAEHLQGKINLSDLESGNASENGHSEDLLSKDPERDPEA